MAAANQAQMEQIAVLQQNIANATTDVAMKAAVCALANYRELVAIGASQPGILSEGSDAGGPANPYQQNRAG
jgi:hypothetical protein